MTLSLAGVLADARSLWRGARELLLPVAGVFFFLPALALRLFLPQPDVSALVEEEAMRVALDWLSTNAPWFALQLVVQLLGSAVVLVLLLDRDRPPAGAAIGKGAALLPRLIAGSALLLLPLGALTMGLLVIGGPLLFVLAIGPFFYVLGRSFVLLPLLAAERDTPLVGAVTAALRRTAGNGWRLLLLMMLVYFPLMLVGEILLGIGEKAGPAGGAIVALCVSVVSAAAVLAQLLLQIAAYRLLTVPEPGPKQGM